MYLGRLVKELVISSVTQSANLFTCGLNAHATIKVENYSVMSLLFGGFVKRRLSDFFILSSISTP